MAEAVLAGGNGVHRAAGPPATAAPPESAATRRDAFPHTRRPLPWLLAGFVALLFLVPVDSTEVKMHLPVGSQIDRFAVVVLVLAWICFGGDQRAFLRTRRSKLYVGAACVFLALAVASLLLDAGRIINLGDFTLAEKQFALLGSALVVAWFALTALRFEDLRGFFTYLIGLATLTAIGMLVERHMGFNAFYNWSGSILRPIAKVAPSPTNIHPEPGTDGRVQVFGPTLNGLAAATMLVMVMPFALARLLDARSRRSWCLNAAAVALIVAGGAATDKKTAVLVPVAVFLYIAVYRPRQMLRLAPIGLVALVGLVHVASPGALGTLISPSSGAASSSTTHRQGDFTNVAPDVLARPVLGRGFGTVNVDHPKEFRINDDEYIDIIWQVGVLGLLAYVSLILAPAFLARRAIRGRDPTISSLALAASAGCIAYFVANALFDAMAYPQVPYVFFIVAGLTTVAAAGPAGNVQPIRARARQLARRPHRVLAGAPSSP
jgi:hypothetical protein